MSEISLDWSLCLFLSVLSHFTPTWLDYILAILVILWNVYLFIRFKGRVPVWFYVLVAVQSMALLSGFYTDHDPTQGEFGGTDTSRGQKEDWL